MNFKRGLIPAIPALLFLAAFFLLPVTEMLMGSFQNTSGEFSLENFQRIAATPVYGRVLGITFWISAVTAILAVLLAYPVSYLLTRLSPYGRERWLLWIMLPFWTSYLVKTYAWMLLLSRKGLLTTFAANFVDNPSGLVPAVSGVIIGMVHAMLPLAVVTLLPIMRTIDQRLMPAAQTLGASRAMGFFSIFLPLSAPGIAAATLLVFITSLGFFIVPALLGSPREMMVAQLVISSVLDLFDLHFAGALSVVLLACSLLVFLVYDRVAGLSSLGGEAPKDRKAGRGLMVLIGIGHLFSRFGRERPRAGDSRLLTGYSVLLVLLLILPVLIVVPLAFTSSPFIAFPPKLFSLKWFTEFFTSAVWQTALLRSLGVGVATALLALILGFGATMALTRLSAGWRKALFTLFIAPLIVPRIVIALGLLYLFSRIGLAGKDLGLVLGHTVLALPYVVVTLSAAFKQYDWRLDDAARSLGAGTFTRLRTVTLPLMSASLVSAFLLAFITSFDDLTIASSSAAASTPPCPSRCGTASS
ncbi:ABC transporter permease subunit [Pseudomonas sp. Marseille-Q5115]|uniref:ABC transporter permease subunit n=1 Tax=Pseudomonas sp. Marseille-Q5115 TaxID=2866593 RepID=UPI001CE441BF|nr:ABC transporter permease subunit [Pseudomonas sp. Marseille-Q5115]